jgi:hypothetical protein
LASYSLTNYYCNWQKYCKAISSTSYYKNFQLKNKKWQIEKKLIRKSRSVLVLLWRKHFCQSIWNKQNLGRRAYYVKILLSPENNQHHNCFCLSNSFFFYNQRIVLKKFVYHAKIEFRNYRYITESIALVFTTYWVRIFTQDWSTRTNIHSSTRTGATPPPSIQCTPVTWAPAVVCGPPPTGYHPSIRHTTTTSDVAGIESFKRYHLYILGILSYFVRNMTSLAIILCQSQLLS